MKLDRHTYEAWLLDRSDGNLSPDQEQLLDAFLLANPDLAAPKGALPRLERAGETFNGKKSLLRSFPPAGAPAAATLNDFLAAHLEGDLSAEQEKQLERYLYEHPEAARDAAAMAKAKMVAAPMPFEDKPKLERHFPPFGMPDAQRLTDFLIADAEGDLDAEQQFALERYLAAHPGAQHEQRLIAAARVLPEPVGYPRKKEMLKREVRILPLWPRWAAAASIALLLGLGWWASRNNQQPTAGLAQATIHGATATAPSAAAADAVQNGQPPATIGDKGHRAVAGPAAPARVHTVQRAPASACNKPEPGIPTVQEPTPDPVLPDPPPVFNSRSGAVASTSPQEQPAPGPPGVPDEAVATAAAPASRSQELGVYVANKLRDDVLDAPRRQARLDGSDALAMADRAISAISNGQVGLQVQRSSTRERFRFSLGRNFSISASRGR